MIKIVKYLAIFVVVFLTYISCGGGGGGAGDSSASNSGTSLTGAPFSNAVVLIKNANGDKIVTSEDNVRTDSNGNFNISEDLLSGNGPYFLRATKIMAPDYTSVHLYSLFTSSMLSKGIKITPISSMIASIALPEGKSLEDGFTEYGQDFNVTEDNLNSAVDVSFKLLKPLLESRGITSENSDFLVSGEIEADGTGLDGLCEVVDFKTSADKISITPKSKSLKEEVEMIEFAPSVEGVKKLEESGGNPVSTLSEATKNEQPKVLIFSKVSSYGEGKSWGGYIGSIIIVNGSSDTIDGWRVDFSSESIKINNQWNAESVVDDKTPENGHSFLNLTWNRMINKTRSIGFGASGTFSDDIIGKIKDATLNGKPILVKYMIDGKEVYPESKKNKDSFLPKIKNDDGAGIDKTILKETKEDQNESKEKIETIIKDEDAKKAIKDTDNIKYVLNMKRFGQTDGDFGVALRISNADSYFKKFIKISIKKPLGMEMSPEQGCYGDGKCVLEVLDDRLLITLVPWSGNFKGLINFSFRSNGFMVDNVGTALAYNSKAGEDSIPVKVAYENAITKEQFEKYKKDMVTIVKKERKEKLAKKVVKKVPKEKKELEDKIKPKEKIRDFDGRHFSVGYLATWSLTRIEDNNASATKAANKVPGYNYIIVAFARPELTATMSGINNIDKFKGGFKRFIKILQARGTKVLIAVGGINYGNWTSLANEYDKPIADTTHMLALKNLVDEYGFDGLDVDYEKNGINADEYAKTIIAMKRVALDRGILLTLAAWSTGSDCTGSMVGQYGCTQDEISFWGNRAGREKTTFALLQSKYDFNVSAEIDMINIMSYDGQTNRFDPVHLHKSYREIYTGPLGLGLETATEGWKGAELTVFHDDAKKCGSTSMLKGNSYSTAVDPEASYSMERFAKYLKDVDKGHNGFMLWHTTKTTTNITCSKAAGPSQIFAGIEKLLFGVDISADLISKSTDGNVKGIVELVKTESKKDLIDEIVKETKRLPMPLNIDYGQIENDIINKDANLPSIIKSIKTFRDFDHSSWPIKDGLPNFEVDATNLPPNVQRVKRILTEDKWNYLFPLANVTYSGTKTEVVKNIDGPTYTYKNFLNAASFYPAFCSEAWEENGDLITNSNKLDIICKKELSTMFAHFAQEVGAHDNVYEGINDKGEQLPREQGGVLYDEAIAQNPKLIKYERIPQWRQGLYHVTEAGCKYYAGVDVKLMNGEELTDEYKTRAENETGCLYQTCNMFECGDPKTSRYFGRGAKQLSYNYNYIPFSIVLTVKSDSFIFSKSFKDCSKICPKTSTSTSSLKS